MAQNAVVQALLEQIAKHWGWEVGDKVRQEIQNIINAHNIDLQQLQSAIQTIQGLLDADPATPEFDVGQNIISQLTDHLTRITNLESDVTTLKGDESMVGSVRYIAKSYMEAEREAREAADEDLQAQINEIKGGSEGTSLAGLQAEVDNIKNGVGLSDDGSYVPNTAAHYIDEAVSVVDATEKLDAKLKEVEDRVIENEGATNSAIQELQSSIAQAKAEAVEQAKSEVFDAIAAISANTLASIFREALECGFAGKPKDDVLNGTGDCAAANTSSNEGSGDGGDGAVL